MPHKHPAMWFTVGCHHCFTGIHARSMVAQGIFSFEIIFPLWYELLANLFPSTITPMNELYDLKTPFFLIDWCFLLLNYSPTTIAKVDLVIGIGPCQPILDALSFTLIGSSIWACCSGQLADSQLDPTLLHRPRDDVCTRMNPYITLRHHNCF